MIFPHENSIIFVALKDMGCIITLIINSVFGSILKVMVKDYNSIAFCCSLCNLPADWHSFCLVGYYFARGPQDS